MTSQTYLLKGELAAPDHVRGCPTCGAALQASGRYNRCPWVKASDKPPTDGRVWPCSWPRGRLASVAVEPDIEASLL